MEPAALPLWTFGAAAILGYLLGSIPFGLVLTKAAGLGDIRNIGSGNIGATNVLRTGNKKLALATLLLDGGKGAIAALIATHYDPLLGVIAGAAALLGHLFPVWLGFKGGKGVATTMGVSLGLAWPVGLAYAVVWLGMLAITRISSLAGMTAALAAPIAALALGKPEFVPVLGAIALLVLWLHRANVGRLRVGTEPKVGQKS